MVYIFVVDELYFGGAKFPSLFETIPCHNGPWFFHHKYPRKLKGSYKRKKVASFSEWQAKKVVVSLIMFLIWYF